MNGSLLDGEGIRRRRLTLVLTERELARQLGVSATLIDALERGRNHAELPFAFVHQLATVLGMRLDELVPTPPAHDTDHPEDSVTVGRLLAHLDASVPVSILADTAGWTLEHTNAALDTLETRLAGVGMRLVRTAAGVGLAPAPGDSSRVQVLMRRAAGRRGMNVGQVRMLYRVWRGEITGKENSNADRVNLGNLINAGLVEHPAGNARGGRPTLTGDVDLAAGTSQTRGRSWPSASLPQTGHDV